MSHIVHLFITTVLFAAHLLWLIFMPAPINHIPTVAVGGWFIGIGIYHASKWLADYLHRRGFY